MGLPAEKRLPAVYADLEAVPAHLVAEIINGELQTLPRPAPKHAKTASFLGGELHGPYHKGLGGPGGWIILDEPEIHLGPDVLVPDLAGWRVERMPELPDAAYFTLPPDWICEVLSPSTEAVDRADKMPIYAREGVRHAWLLDQIRTVHAASKGSYGWRRVHAELTLGQGIVVAHTTVEMLHRSDIEQTIRLMYETLLTLTPKTNLSYFA